MFLFKSSEESDGEKSLKSKFYRTLEINPRHGTVQDMFFPKKNNHIFDISELSHLLICSTSTPTTTLSSSPQGLKQTLSQIK